VLVAVAVADDRVDVTVDSSGAPGRGTGMGLVNMRERAEAVGGTCTAGPGGRGWLVTASLPNRVAPNGRAG
jgi:signal transduction histidine kinase